MAVRPMLGTLSEFQPETEALSTYVERAKIFFAANDVAEDKQLSVFLTVIGKENFALLRDLLAPAKPQDKSLNDVIEALKKHFEPKPLITAERFHFHRRDQLPTETVAEYVAQLRRLSVNCEFGAHLDDALRDRLVCGLRSEAMQKRLLSVKDLTFQDALDTAQAMESADKGTKALQGPRLSQCISPQGVVHEVSPAKGTHQNRSTLQLHHAIGVVRRTIPHRTAASLMQLAIIARRRVTLHRCVDRRNVACPHVSKQQQKPRQLTTSTRKTPCLLKNCISSPLA